MHWIFYVKALVMGAVEGLTEFLPISSTGHLIIVGDLLDFTGEQAKSFTISIQLGAIFAVCWYYRARISAVARSLHSERRAQRFVANLLLAFLPAALLGVMCHGFIKEYLFNPLNVAVALIVGGFVILAIEHLHIPPRIKSVEDLVLWDALKIGCAQAVSLIPGTSRSGATIMGGLIFGLSRQAATEFSFFLAIPTMFAATIYELYKHWSLLGADDVGLFTTGFSAAFFSAFFAVRRLLHYVANHDFSVFAYYRILFGALVLAYFWN
jgi:undecaprenyl-diphosphatase UppP